MRKSIKTDVDGLIHGINTILSEDRYSFSDDDKALLEAALELLETSKIVNPDIRVGWSLVFKALEVVMKVFIDSDGFSNFG